MKIPFQLKTLILFALSLAVRADVTLAPLFRDGAILQRDQSLPVWGKAAAGEKIAVRFKSQVMTTTAGPDGRWRVDLSPEPAATASAELVVAGTNTVRVRDVLVGDVWLCSGQSNMVFLMRNVANAEREIPAAKFPLIRQFKVPLLIADKPADDVPGTWAACSPETVGTYSAVAYFFARDLFQKYGVPIGLVNSAWGGTPIEGWMSEPALRGNPAAKSIYARWEQLLAEYPAKVSGHAQAVEKWKAAQAAVKKAGKATKRRAPPTPEGPGSRWQPAGMYNAMIAPLIPYALRGALWYQGENNAPRYAEYGSLFTTMIEQWRADFGQRLPFYFVQLANFERGEGNTGTMWAFQREAQAQALALPDTGMAVTIDVGNPTNIHPTNKQDVGQRLARHARHQLFGEKIETDGPVFKSARRDGKAMRVSFTHAEGLRLAAAKDDGRIAFEVAGEDHKFAPAEAWIEGGEVVVSAATVASPAAVRYAWRNSPDARLFNAAGLPAAPFRSDRWK